MNKLLVSLILATAGAIFVSTVEGYGWYNATRYQPKHAGYSGHGIGFRNITNSSSIYPHSNYTRPYRFPRSTPYWGNSSQNASHNFFWGHKTIYDRLLYFTRVKKASSFLRKVTQDVDFPARYQHANGTIYCIEVLDQKPVGDGGYASILRGGVGYRNVSIHFKSERNKGFDFQVYIYGH